jgi:bla regulator protein BlaR1
MIAQSLSAIPAAIAPAVANHLWQSTLCAVIAGLLALTSRTNQAKIRYRIWLTASIKFLIPFSLLVSLGDHFARPRIPAPTQPALYFVMQEVSQPFAHPSVPAALRTAPPATLSNFFHLLPVFLLAVWLCGIMTVMSLWWIRLWRLSAIARTATPLRQGREVKALRRLENIGGMRKQIEVLLSAASLEPGIFGIARPVLLWPEGISDHLEDPHLEAILAHEVLHVRRRDNLAAAVHMVVEAVFWFHPLVWWLGKRLLEERERACDEEVLRFGNTPRIYAESILRACEFCVRSPLACVSGVTGADLKKRIVHIMERRVTHGLNLPKKLLLGIVGVLTLTVPLLFGLLNGTQTKAESEPSNAGANVPAFEVASIKPNQSGERNVRMMNPPDGRFVATNVTLKMLIQIAYGVQEYQISGAPGWLNSERYDIEAKSDSSVDDELHKLSPDQIRLLKGRMLQGLLADRFKLTLRQETKELPVFALVVAKSGPKLKQSTPGDTYANGIKGPDGVAHPGMMLMRPGQITGQALPITSLARMLSQQLNRTIVDKTGLTGQYDITLQWTPDEEQIPKGMGNGSPINGGAPPEDSSGPSIFTAIQEQLGLKLESQKGPVEILVIDHVEEPSAN